MGNSLIDGRLPWVFLGLLIHAGVTQKAPEEGEHARHVEGRLPPQSIDYHTAEGHGEGDADVVA